MERGCYLIFVYRVVKNSFGASFALQDIFLSFSIASVPSLYFTLLFSSFSLFFFYLLFLLLHSSSSLASVSSSPAACGTFSVM